MRTPPILRGGPPGVSTESLLLPLYGTIGSPRGWSGFLDALSDAYGGSMTCLTAFDFACRGGSAEATSGCDKSYVASYGHHYARLNPWMPLLEQRAVGDVTLSDNTLPYADLRRTEFYNDWCRPQGFGGGVGGFVERSGRRIVAVSVLMPRFIIDQDAEVRSRLEILMPHLLWVSGLHRQFATLEARAIAAEGAIDRLGTAMVLLGASGQIVYMNARAERIAAASDGVIVRRGRLCAASSAENEVLRRLIEAARLDVPALDSPPGGVMRIRRPSGREALELLVAPIADTTIRLGVNGPMVAVFIREPEARLATPVAWLRRLHGLTAAEGRLMHALLFGETLEEVAARYAVGRETVRSQLKAVFRKTGTASQSELLRLGLRSLAARYG